ncbi:MAG: iron-sulfur cluster repair di-iron protein [Acidimicrobiia bacterium]|nr:iron-sulfur cluster repair di-iron protein [Acidimicrobiia bacterium]
MTATGDHLTIDDQITLGDLVTQHPSVARPLEKLGLDYCCHGQRSLADAVAQAGHSIGEVKSILAESMVPNERPEWAGLAPADLADHVIDTHHRYLWEELPRLSFLVDKIAEVHGGRHPELAKIQSLYATLRVEFEPHLRREELMVFPAVRQLADGKVPKITAPVAGEDPTLEGRIHTLIEEHDATGEILDEMREISDGFVVPDDGCATYQLTYQALDALEGDTHLHVHKENNVLFPAAIDLEKQVGSAT